MMQDLTELVLRDISDYEDDASLAPAMANILLTLLVFIILAFCCIVLLFYYRRKRHATRQALLPMNYNHKSSITTALYSGPAGSIDVHEQKRNYPVKSSSPLSSPVPEIRITFPDEETSGNTEGGRAVIVHIGDSGNVGMEPVSRDNLPSYQSSESDHFQSLDLERIGGLKEKDESSRLWT